MRSLIRQLFPRPASTVPAPRTTLPQTAGLQIVVPVIRVSDLPRR